MEIWIFSIVLFATTFVLEHAKGHSTPQTYDVAFLIDRSNSIGHHGLYEIKSTVEDVTSHFSVAPSNSRVALVSFASFPRVEHHFKQTVNREKLLSKLEKIRHVGGSTDLNAALIAMYKLFARESRHHAKKILFIFTDGRVKSSLVPGNVLSYIRKMGIQSYIFGSGRHIFSPGLDYLVSRLDADEWINPRWPQDYIGMINELSRSHAPFTTCSGSGYVRDECDRLCTCLNGKKRNCYRVRKEFNEMTYDERVRYLKAFRTLSNSKKYRKRYDRLIKIHVTFFCKGIHGAKQFFPWHRWYLWHFENLLREVDCRLTVPYWDWSYWSKEAWSTKHIWRSTPDGLGGNGNANNSFCVDTGLFVRGNWKLPSYYNISKVVEEIVGCSRNYSSLNATKNPPRCLRRNFNGRPPTRDTIHRLLHLPISQYLGFVSEVADGYHNDIHNNIGGDMCTNFASYDPIFFMHHGNLDKIWYLWQSICPRHLKASRDPNVKLLSSPFRSSSFIDGHNLPDDVKVTYSSFGQVNRKRELEDFSTLWMNSENSTIPAIVRRNRTDSCRSSSFAPDKQRQRVAKFLKLKDFPYNPSLLGHLDEYNL